MASEFKTLDEQIEELKEKGLLISSEEEAKRFLLYNSLERLKGYMDAFLVNGNFVHGTTFDMIVEAYLFDHKLRHILLLYLETIEVSLKSVYCYEFSKVHGSTGYLDSSLYNDSIKYQEVLVKVEKQRAKAANNDPSLKPFDNNGIRIDLPISVYIEFFTIKDITNFYMLSEKNTKKRVALSLGLTFENRAVILWLMMSALTYLRNVCAHGKRIYNFDLLAKPPLSKREKRKLLKDSNGKERINALFGYLFILKRLLPKEDYNRLKNSIIFLTKKYPSIDMKHYGCPSCWKKMV